MEKLRAAQEEALASNATSSRASEAVEQHTKVSSLDNMTNITVHEAPSDTQGCLDMAEVEATYGTGSSDLRDMSFLSLYIDDGGVNAGTNVDGDATPITVADSSERATGSSAIDVSSVLGMPAVSACRVFGDLSRDPSAGGFGDCIGGNLRGSQGSDFGDELNGDLDGKLNIWDECDYAADADLAATNGGDGNATHEADHGISVDNHGGLASTEHWSSDDDQGDSPLPIPLRPQVSVQTDTDIDTSPRLLPPDVYGSMAKLATCLDSVRSMLPEAVRLDATLSQYIRKAHGTWGRVGDRRVGEPDRPLFLFKDGPLTCAAKQSHPILLEDFDHPSQAVTERLNSLLEPTPTFAITEDITISEEASGEGNADGVRLGVGFQVFATIHQRSAHARLRISPATRSRFTEIRAPTCVQVTWIPCACSVSPCCERIPSPRPLCRYTQDELRAVWKAALTQNPQANEAVSRDTRTSIHKACNAVFALRDLINAATAKRAGAPLGVRHLFRVVSFIGNHTTTDISFSRSLVLGCRFMLADGLQQESSEIHPTGSTPSELVQCATEWFRVSQADLGLEPSDWTWFVDIFMPPTRDMCDQWLEVLESGAIRCCYGGIVVQRAGADVGERKGTDAPDPGPTRDLLESTRLTCTPTMLTNIARILAAHVSRAPMLLEGPPGIGTCTHLVTTPPPPPPLCRPTPLY